MMDVPDGIEVVATRVEAEDMQLPPLLVLESLTEFLDARGLGAGAVSWSRIGEGHSNVTYLINRGDRKLVLRRGPRPPLPPSTHDMVRESRIQLLAQSAGIPVPNIVAVCEDSDVLGVPFYVMDFLDGVVMTDTEPAGFDAIPQRQATAFQAIDTLATLHAADVTRGGLERIGRPEGYLERQVHRFASLWGTNSRRDIPAVAEIANWLTANLPTSQRNALVHGDYRIGNLMLEPSTPPRVMAILDWEMATVGDPLADLGYFLATYADPSAAPTPLELTPVTREAGYPTRDELAERYAATTRLDLSDLRWYKVLALWKAAVFCEAIYTRWLDGERPGDEFAPTLADGVPGLIHEACALI